ncbi:MAG: hypothetical protein AAB432_03145 [Patescibacteria group bacterium]
MRIIIVSNDKIYHQNDFSSIIEKDGNIKELSELPKSLQEMMVELFKKLREVKSIIYLSSIEKCVLELSNRNELARDLEPKIREEFINVIRILNWFLGRHWQNSAPGRIGARITCIDCGAQTNVKFPQYCEEVSCPSHEKWQKVLGPSYVPPTW